jgi:hypothetical protein
MIGDTPRSGDTLQSVESLMSDKDDIRRQITELNKQRERAQNMMEKIARQEADLMQVGWPNAKLVAVRLLFHTIISLIGDGST